MVLLYLINIYFHQIFNEIRTQWFVKISLAIVYLYPWLEIRANVLEFRDSLFKL